MARRATAPRRSLRRVREEQLLATDLVVGNGGLAGGGHHPVGELLRQVGQLEEKLFASPVEAEVRKLKHDLIVRYAKRENRITQLKLRPL